MVFACLLGQQALVPRPMNIVSGLPENRYDDWTGIGSSKTSESKVVQQTVQRAATSLLLVGVLLFTTAESAGPGVRATESVISLAQHLALLTEPVQLVLLAGGVHSPVAAAAPHATSSAANGTAFGIARTLRLEHANMRVFAASLTCDAAMVAQ